MSWRESFALGLVASTALAMGAASSEFGRPAAPEEIALWNIDVRPDGIGLPNGSGTALRGKHVFEENCSGCHGDQGQGGLADRLVGGQGTLASDHPVKTVGSYWPYATSLFDYVRRAMPYSAPQTLSDDDTYAVVAYLLELNGIIPADFTLDGTSLPAIKMPNRNGFWLDPEFKVIHNSRQP